MNKKILITGVTGFIGRATTHHLMQKGYDVYGYSRTPSDLFLDKQANRMIIGDIRDFETLHQALIKKDIVIHLAALKNDEIESEAVNIGGVKNLIKACIKQNVSKIINISTQSACFKKRGLYGETKYQADLLFHASGLNMTTLRPSLVYGDDKNGAFNKLCLQIKKWPFVPVIGKGQNLFQPIHVHDLAQIIESSLSIEDHSHCPYNIGGPDTLTFDQLIDEIMNWLEIKKRKIHLPWKPGYYLVWLLRSLTHNFPISVSNLLGLADENSQSFNIEKMMNTFKVKPLSFKEGLKQIPLSTL